MVGLSTKSFIGGESAHEVEAKRQITANLLRVGKYVEETQLLEFKMLK